MALFTFVRSDFLDITAGDQGLQIAWMHWHQNPNLYPGDPITIAFKDYHSLLLRWLSSLSLSERYEQVVGGLHLLSLAALYGMLLWLSWSLFKDWLTAYWTVIMAAVIPLPALAGSPVINSQFVPSAMAIPLIIGALVAYFHSRWVLMGATLGLAALLHPLEGGVAFAALYLALLISSRGREIKSAIFTLLIFCIISSPILIIMLRAGVASGGASGWIDVLRWRSPHHIFPLSWSVGTWGRFLLFAVAGCFSFALWKRESRSDTSSHLTKKIYGLAASVGILAIMGVFFAEFIPWAIIIKSQPLRSANLIVIAALPFIAYTLIQAYKRMKTKGPENDDSIQTRNIFTANYLLLVFASMMMPVLTMLLLADQFEDAVEQQSVVRGSQIWARQNTRPEQQFLCLPPLENFRTLSHRPEFGSWKDGTLANFSPDYAVEWRRRMELLGMTWTPEFKGYRGAAALAALWAKPTIAQVQRVLSAEPCDFIVARSNAPLPESPEWKPVFQNVHVIIYEVQQPTIP